MGMRRGKAGWHSSDTWASPPARQIKLANIFQKEAAATRRMLDTDEVEEGSVVGMIAAHMSRSFYYYRLNLAHPPSPLAATALSTCLVSYLLAHGRTLKKCDFSVRICIEYMSR